MDELRPGLLGWTARHPEWRTTVEEVGSYAVVAHDGLALVDALLPPEGDPARVPLLAEIDRRVTGSDRLEILVVSPYHTRSAEELWQRYRERLPARIWGHPRTAARFTDPSTPLDEIPRGPAGGGRAFADGIAVAYVISRPARQETPLYLPAAKAVAFADAVVGDGRGLRVWNDTDIAHDSLRKRLHPTLAPLLELDVDHVLVTHGPPVLDGGREALAAALEAEPVDQLPWPPRGDAAS